MNYQEGNLYKISHDYYNDIKIECTYVEDNTVWFINRDTHALYRDYKVSLKTKKLYVFNKHMASWDTIENTLSEYTAEDIWSKKTGNGSGGGYSGNMGQD